MNVQKNNNAQNNTSTFLKKNSLYHYLVLCRLKCFENYMLVETCDKINYKGNANQYKCKILKMPKLLQIIQVLAQQLLFKISHVFCDQTDIKDFVLADLKNSK